MSFDFGVDIDVDSQDSQLNEEELDKLVEDSKAKRNQKMYNLGIEEIFPMVHEKKHASGFKNNNNGRSK